MNKMTIVGVLLVMSGCGQVLLPPTPKECVPESLIDPPDDAEQATTLIIDQYVAATGKPRPSITVNWVSDTVHEPDESFQTTYGTYCGCDDLIVYTSGPGYPTHRTALAHEIAHCMAAGDLFHTSGFWWDDGSLDDKFNGQVINAQDMLAAAGF